MAAYYIALARATMSDNWHANMQPYRDHVEVTMQLYGGHYATYMRHRVELVEGDYGAFLGPTIVEFPSWEQLWAWYHSEEYAPLKQLRQENMQFDVMLVDGLTDEELAENERLMRLGQKGVV